MATEPLSWKISERSQVEDESEATREKKSMELISLLL